MTLVNIASFIMNSFSTSTLIALKNFFFLSFKINLEAEIKWAAIVGFAIFKVKFIMK